MNRKIIGVTVGSPLPKSNLNQTDPTKGDYVKGREAYALKSEIKPAFDEALEQAKASGKLAGVWVGSEAPTDSGYSVWVDPEGRSTPLPDSGGNVDQEQITTAINTALAQAKESGEFDGKDGVDGQPGKDGYTPQKNVDYFDGKDGSPGADGSDGITPHIGSNGNWFIGNTDTGKPSRGADGQPGQSGSPGKDGSAGADGISPTVAISKSGKVTTVSITDKNGTKTATINDGADGKDGQPGKDGSNGVDGADGQRGAGILNTTTGIAAYTTAVGGVSPQYRILLSTLKTQAKVNEVLVGDTVRYSTFIYPVIYIDESYAYMGTRISLQGSAGSSITVKSVNESTADEGSNIVTFSDGKTLTVKNGKKGTDGKDGTSLNVTSYETSDGRNGMTFETTDYLPDGTPVTQNHGSIEDGKDYILTEADKAEIVSRVVETIGGNPIYGVVDTNNHIVLNGNLSVGNYVVKYEMEDGTTVNIGNLVLDTNVYYTVTNNLTNCTSSNSAKQAVEGESYSATITAASGYELSSIKVTMGGNNVTVTNGVINIANVTGNIVITAVAEEIQTGPTNLANPTSADWKDGYRLSVSSGGTSALAGHITTNFIPCKQGDTLRVKGLWFVDVNDNTTGSSPNCKLGLYKASKEWIKGIYGSMGVAANTTYGNKVSVNGDIQEYTIMIDSTGVQQAPSETAYLRIDGKFMDGYTKKDVIITINKPIE